MSASLRLPTLSAEAVWALVGFVGLSAFFFRDALFGGRVLFRRDIALVWLPQVESFVRCVGAGSWPLWDPYRGFGQPLLADPSAEILYPPAWIHLIAPPATSYLIFVLFHLGLSGLGVYTLARRWGTSSVGALVGAGTWIASGPFLSLASLWVHMAGAAWMPWVLVAADEALEHGGATAIVLWGAATACQIVAGSFDMVAMTAAAILIDVFVRRVEWRRPAGERNRSLLRAAVVSVFIGLALSAAQWIPTVAFAHGTARAGLPQEVRETWSVPPLGLLEVLLPFHWMDLPLRQEVMGRVLGLDQSFLHSIYVGIPVLLLAVAGVAAGRDRRPISLALMALAAVLIALGPHAGVYRLVVTLLPPLRAFRYPMKIMVLFALAVSLLAAMGFDSWSSASLRRNARWVVTVVTPSVFLAALTVGFVRVVRLGGPILFQSGADHAVLADAAAGLRATEVATIAAAGLAAWAWRCRPSTGPWVAALTATLALTDLALAHRNLNATARPGLFSEVPPVLATLDRRPYARLYVVDYINLTRFQRARMPWLRSALILRGIPDGWSFLETLSTGAIQILQPPTSGRWGWAGSYDQDLLGLQQKAFSELDAFVREAEPTWIRRRLLQMASVGNVVALLPEPWLNELVPVTEIPSLFQEPIRVFRVPNPLPRTYVASRARVVDGPSLLAAFADPAFDPAAEILLPEASVIPRDEGVGGAGESHIVSLQPDRVRIDASLDTPGYVVLLDGYDSGWRATVDGNSAAILRANGVFRAVHVAGGNHRVEFVYRPTSVAVGLAVTAMTLVGLCSWAIPRWLAKGEST